VLQVNPVHARYAAHPAPVDRNLYSKYLKSHQTLINIWGILNDFALFELEVATHEIDCDIVEGELVVENYFSLPTQKPR
jgi:hypothetical protein